MPEVALAPRLGRSYDRGQAIAELIRPQSSRISAGMFLAAALGAHLSVASTAGGLVLIVASYGLAATLNDIADVETDRRNGRTRPLATGALDLGDARRVAIVCTIAIGASQALLVQPGGLYVTFLAIAVAATYSRGPGLQRRGLIAHVVLAVGYLVLPVLLAATQAGRVPATMPATCFVLVFSGTGILLYKDFKDEAGDRSTGKRTPLVRWGAARTHAAAELLVAGAVVVGVSSSGVGWWTAPMVVALGLQAAHARGVVDLVWLRNWWYLACLLLVAA